MRVSYNKFLFHISNKTEGCFKSLMFVVLKKIKNQTYKLAKNCISIDAK